MCVNVCVCECECECECVCVCVCVCVTTDMKVAEQINNKHTTVVLIRGISTVQHKVADFGLADAASAVTGELVCSAWVGCGGWGWGPAG